jgi:hypothetical protein
MIVKRKDYENLLAKVQSEYQKVDGYIVSSVEEDTILVRKTNTLFECIEICCGFDGQNEVNVKVLETTIPLCDSYDGSVYCKILYQLSQNKYEDDKKLELYNKAADSFFQDYISGEGDIDNELLYLYIAYMIEAGYEDVENDITDKFLKQYLCEEIMNDTNNHNPNLVEKINEIWNNLDKREDFVRIINTLILRDYVECSDKGVLDVERYVDKYYEYLMHVADDHDLETIISFVR